MKFTLCFIGESFLFHPDYFFLDEIGGSVDSFISFLFFSFLNFFWGGKISFIFSTWKRALKQTTQIGNGPTIWSMSNRDRLYYILIGIVYSCFLFFR